MPWPAPNIKTYMTDLEANWVEFLGNGRPNYESISTFRQAEINGEIANGLVYVYCHMVRRQGRNHSSAPYGAVFAIVR